MKAIFLTSILVAFFLFTNVSAGNPKDKIYSNIETNNYGTIKEYTTISHATAKATNKAVYIYDTNGILQERALYSWDETQGWLGICKYEYEYHSHKLTNIIYTKWDNDIATWSSMAEHLIHIYNTEGKFLTVKHIQVNNDYNLMAIK